MSNKDEFEPGEFDEPDLGEGSGEGTNPSGRKQNLYSSSLTEQTEEVNEDEVKSLLGDEIEKKELYGTGFTYRHDWGDKHGSWKLNLNWGAIKCNSRVFVSATEFGADQCAFVGGAKYTVNNVAPRNGAVTVWLDINWDSNIRVRLDYLVVNP